MHHGTHAHHGIDRREVDRRPSRRRPAIGGREWWASRSPVAAVHRSEEGSSVVEAVIVVPVVMLLLLVCVQFCLWMHAVQVAQVAASEGDRVARAFGGGPSAGTAAAEGVLRGPGSDVTGSSVTVSVLPGDSAWLQVSGHALSILPGLAFGVSASATGPIQQFRGSE
jgi:hypothetical protein